MNRVIHFEIHGKDLDKLQKFYQDVFGWDIQDMGSKFGNYRLIRTGTSAPGIDGGLTARHGDGPAQGAPVNAFVCTVSVDNLDATLAKIAQAGGTVATDKMEIPGVGTLAYRKDPEGNIFGVLQPVKQ
jgi:predicted enzyme related to lactoylglutathione lyase